MSQLASGVSPIRLPTNHALRSTPRLPTPPPPDPENELPFLSPELLTSTLKKIHKSRSQLRLHLFQTTETPFQNIHIGALIFNGPKLLVIKHVVDETCCYDIPSRKMADEDFSVIRALIGVVKEQTGMEVALVVRELMPAFQFKIPWVVHGEQFWSPCVQLNFVVGVRAGGFDSGNGRENLFWIEEGEGREMDMPDGVKGLVRWAFADRLIHGSWI
ncbi:hypothetical protein GLAREA_05476 [Glarea lozoyensis ATCC 20868]|uniref:Nudix hydrolase domain-containing protein n=1 Tax=Glarea lozoyensis (strain ATCC 20868 / MF5171) TaxID=1116229 RepID=S3ECW4_GLAL2|nr:uncharacterized protein GLAREA_05476 [Glarea lozoyensis ATCC 20868]EPE36138.1 hypothetical protein GLAREA_05476 [Glarea lozoyensis ATCC 20868]